MNVDEALKALLSYGALGIVSMVSMYMTARLYRDLMQERKACREELKTLEDRYISKADTWVQQHQELLKRLTDLVEERNKRLR